MKNSLESSLSLSEWAASSSMKDTDSAAVDLERRGIVLILEVHLCYDGICKVVVGKWNNIFQLRLGCSYLLINCCYGSCPLVFVLLVHVGVSYGSCE